jgi:hypothetical protein
MGAMPVVEECIAAANFAAAAAAAMNPMPAVDKFCAAASCVAAAKRCAGVACKA